MSCLSVVLLVCEIVDLMSSVWFVLGLLTGSCHVSPVHLIQSVHCGVCLVCTVTSQEVLHEAVLSVCMDTCSTAHRCNTKLSYHPKYF